MSYFSASNSKSTIEMQADQNYCCCLTLKCDVSCVNHISRFHHSGAVKPKVGRITPPICDVSIDKHNQTVFVTNYDASNDYDNLVQPKLHNINKLHHSSKCSSDTFPTRSLNSENIKRVSSQ